MESPASETASSYSRVAILLHWIIAALVFSTIPLGWYGSEYETDAGQTATNIHKSIGILILGVTLVRVWWRLTHKPPPLPTSIAPVFRAVAKITHVLFYALLLILPLSGWWMSSAVPERHTFGFGLFDVPFLPVPSGWASAGPAHFIHTNLAWLMIGLIGLHILAVIKHFVFGDDNVMTRMLPAVD